MQIDQDWLTARPSQDVCRALTAGGAAAFFVGGCVRNALLGAPVSDLDIATDARPETVLKLAQAAGIKAIPTGIEHGTVTLVVEGIPFEVTTFRKDVETDGRRAVVAFADTMVEDACRRDFTMNALYADPNGRVFDPLNGLVDLEARRVRFIGSATDRIREDYLRVLRYFRFHAWYGDMEQGMDAEALAAISDNLEGLNTLSRERVGQEVLKLLAAPNPAPVVATMRQCGVLNAILPGADDRALAPLLHWEEQVPEQGTTADPILRLAALGDLSSVGDLLRLSKAQGRRVAHLREIASGTMGAAEVAFRHGRSEARAACLLRAALLEMPVPVDLDAQLDIGATAVFPVKAQDLMPDLTGAALGRALKALEQDWINSGFMLSREALLLQLSKD